MIETSVLEKEKAELDRRKKIKQALKKIRIMYDPKRTKYSYRKEYGHRISEARYFKPDGSEFAKVFRVGGAIDFVKIEEETVIFQ